MKPETNINKRVKILKSSDILDYYHNKEGIIKQILWQDSKRCWYRIELDNGYEGVFSVKAKFLEFL